MASVVLPICCRRRGLEDETHKGNLSHLRVRHTEWHATVDRVPRCFLKSAKSDFVERCDSYPRKRRDTDPLV